MANEFSIEIEQLWKEFEYRHHLYWDLVYKFTIAITVFITVPFLYSDNTKVVASYAYIFPFCSFVTSIVAYKILKTESELMALPHLLYREAMTKLLVGKFDKLPNNEYKLSNKRLSIAILIYRLFLYVGPSVSIASLFAIYSTVTKV
jgi:hypothetical protein